MADKYAITRTARCCFNCLNPGHGVAACPTTFLCKVCGKKHHSLLHNPDFNPKALDKTNKQATPKQTPGKQHGSQVTTHQASIGGKNVILATSNLDIKAKTGTVRARCLLDSGSQGCFVTERFVKRAALYRQKSQVSVKSLGAITPQQTNGACIIEILMPDASFVTISCLIMSEISGNLPNERVIISDQVAQKLDEFDLADPDFARPAAVDILLGVEAYNAVVTGEIVHVNGLTLTKTSFGWVISGALSDDLSDCGSKELKCMLSKVDVRLDIQKFWEVEEAPGLNSSCEERLPVKRAEKECNDFYEKTTFRNKSNRIVVKCLSTAVASWDTLREWLRRESST